jgi:hypothetical protein
MNLTKVGIMTIKAQESFDCDGSSRHTIDGTTSLEKSIPNLRLIPNAIIKRRLCPQIKQKSWL